MMAVRTKVLAVLAAVALFGAVAATTPARAEEAREFSWGKVTVDENCLTTTPGEKILQGVIADTRKHVSDHEQRITKLEGRVGALEEGRKPTTPPSGGTSSGGAETPQKGSASMSAGAIVAITGGSLVLAALLTLIVVALFRRDNDNRANPDVANALATAVSNLAQVGGAYNKVRITSSANGVVTTAGADGLVQPAGAAQPAPPAPAPAAPPPASAPAAPPAAPGQQASQPAASIP
jgi:hypothetical protein